MTERARLRTRHDAPHVLAAALRPDNTAEMETTVADGAVLTTIERDSIGGLRTTVDDYVVNLTVADATYRATEIDDANSTQTTDAATSTRPNTSNDTTDE